MVTHELSSIMLYIHPPLAITGHVLICIFTIFLILYNRKKGCHTKNLGILAWMFTFSGLIAGMIWAQLAWSSYWSWDPKETMTLILFSTYSITLLFFIENKLKITKFLALLSCGLVIATVLISFIIAGLHSFI